MRSELETPIAKQFIERWGEDQAEKVLEAAESHMDMCDADSRGSDAFRWAIAITLGFECMSKPGYREHHGITAPWNEIDAWLRDAQVLRGHDGDVDNLYAACDHYKPYGYEVDGNMGHAISGLMSMAQGIGRKI